MNINLITVFFILIISLFSRVDNKKNVPVFKKVPGVRILEEQWIELDPSQIPKDYPVHEIKPLDYKNKNEI